MSICGSSTRVEDYNLPLHVGAIFIILSVSTGACAMPIIALNVPKLHIPTKAHFIFRHFGTGVLIATALVHLLPTAFISLTDPCLPAFFNEQYTALAGAIALAAIFLITIVEMIFSPHREAVSEIEQMPIRQASVPEAVMDVDGATSAQTPQLGRTRSTRSFSYMRRVQAAEQTCDGLAVAINGDGRHHVTQTVDEENVTSAPEKEDECDQEKLAMQCVLLECGILFHSVFIGMALAVSVGREQIVLLIAVAFHQIFEGLALGSRIAAAGWKRASLQPCLMALAYGFTTPLGQAIGIATRNLYDPSSETGLIVVGTMNAISAGLLTFASLVDLLSEDFLTDRSWRTMRGRKRIFAMSLVVFGAFCMSLIGAWA